MNAVVSRIDLTLARVPTPGEEGFRSKAYNDATGRTVTCLTMNPPGNLTIGPGLNLENGITREEGLAVARIRLAKMDEALREYAWYTALDEVRGSVFLDVAYNAGVGGLLHFTSTIHYASVGDWANCRAALLESHAAKANPNRYRPLAALLFSGA